MRDGVGTGAVVGDDRRPLSAQSLSRRSLAGPELEADEVGRQAVDGRAAKRAARSLEEVAVRSLDVEELCDVVDEELQDGVELKLAAERLRRLQERGLLLDPALVLLEQASRMEGERGLAGHCSHHGHLCLRPRPAGGTMEAENADRPVEGPDRRGE